jgi:ribonuclease P/MRP protein subunit RPP1
MIATDAAVHPYPSGDSSLRRMVLTARELGFDSMVAIGGGVEEEIDGVWVLCGVVLSSDNIQDIRGQIRKAGDRKALVMVNAGDYTFNRAILHIKGVHVIRHIERTHKKSFDHIMARMAAERSIAIDIDLQPVIHLRGYPRQKVLQRYRDLIRLHSRFGFPVTISSNAHSVLDQRSVRDLVLLCSLFDMEKEQVNEALAAIGKLRSGRRTVEVVE